MPVCVHCGIALTDTYKRIPPSTVILEKCNNCELTADPYVELDVFLILIDFILLKEGVYRHIIFNRYDFTERGVFTHLVRLTLYTLLIDTCVRLVLFEKFLSGVNICEEEYHGGLYSIQEPLGMLNQNPATSSVIQGEFSIFNSTRLDAKLQATQKTPLKHQNSLHSFLKVLGSDSGVAYRQVETRSTSIVQVADAISEPPDDSYIWKEGWWPWLCNYGTIGAKYVVGMLTQTSYSTSLKACQAAVRWVPNFHTEMVEQILSLLAVWNSSTRFRIWLDTFAARFKEFIQLKSQFFDPGWVLKKYQQSLSRLEGPMLSLQQKLGSMVAVPFNVEQGNGLVSVCVDFILLLICAACDLAVYLTLIYLLTRCAVWIEYVGGFRSVTGYYTLKSLTYSINRMTGLTSWLFECDASWCYKYLAALATKSMMFCLRPLNISMTYYTLESSNALTRRYFYLPESTPQFSIGMEIEGDIAGVEFRDPGIMHSSGAALTKVDSPHSEKLCGKVMSEPSGITSDSSLETHELISKKSNIIHPDGALADSLSSRVRVSPLQQVFNSVSPSGKSNPRAEAVSGNSMWIMPLINISWNPLDLLSADNTVLRSAATLGDTSLVLVRYNYLMSAVLLSMSSKISLIFIAVWKFCNLGAFLPTRIFLIISNFIAVKIFLSSQNTYYYSFLIVGFSYIFKTMFSTWLCCSVFEFPFWVAFIGSI